MSRVFLSLFILALGLAIPAPLLQRADRLIE